MTTIIENYRTKDLANEGIAKITAKGGRIKQMQIAGNIWILAELPDATDKKAKTSENTVAVPEILPEKADSELINTTTTSGKPGYTNYNRKS